MEARVLESPSTRETLVHLRMDHGEVFGLESHDLINRIRDCLAEKIAQSLFEKVDPALINALRAVD